MFTTQMETIIVVVLVMIKIKPIDFEREMQGEFFTPLQDSLELTTMKKGCYGCPMFSICNGCRKDNKRL